jgi:hypothetical protein
MWWSSGYTKLEVSISFRVVKEGIGSGGLGQIATARITHLNHKARPDITGTAENGAGDWRLVSKQPHPLPRGHRA